MRERGETENVYYNVETWSNDAAKCFAILATGDPVTDTRLDAADLIINGRATQKGQCTLCRDNDLKRRSED